MEHPDVQIAMYDMMGRKVRDVVNGRFEPGYHEAIWDGSDEQGGRASEGIYIYRLTSANMPAQMGRVVLK
jgi:flagellar hook assembly protein FlgD